MADDLRSTIEAAAAAVEKETAAETPVIDAESKVVPETPAETPEAEKPEASGTETETPPEGVPAKDQQNPVDKAKEPVKGVEKAPQSWKPAEKAKWQNLDPDIRAEITRREREITRSLSDAAPARKFVEGFQRTVQPYTARFQSLGVQPTQAVEALLRADHLLSSAPAAERAQRMAQMIKDYGVDINMLDQALTGQDVAKTDPLAQVDARVQAAIAPLMSAFQQTQSQQQAAIEADFQRQVQTVENMLEDPKFPLMSMVREDMADIIEINSRRGVTISLPDAYNRAVQMNTEAAEESIKMTKQAQAQKANVATQRALGASLSVSGNPSQVLTQVPSSDLRGTLEAAMAQHSGRS